MSAVTVSHRENWVLTIRREDGDQWPDLPVPSGRPAPSRQTYLPGQIAVFLERGASHPVITASGQVRNADGQPGRRTVRKQFQSWDPVPDWVAELVEKHRQANRLGPGATGVSW